MKLLILTIILSCLFAFSFKGAQEKDYKMTLSEYGFFEGELKDLLPAEHVVPYDINAPLFSDYAHKLRFIAFPDSGKAVYDPEKALEFPEGTAIIKHFYYYKDERKPKKGRQILETRLLIKEDGEWIALPYVWTEDQNEAFLDVAGTDIPIEWKNNKGKKMKVNYSVPNMNQCKGCHIWDDEIKPIGPSARQLNKSFNYGDIEENQLVYWESNQKLKNLPPLEEIDKLVSWEANGHSAELKARSYLDANCGHCHNPHGPANTSGLFLHSNETDLYKLGYMKPPVAAGRGAGNREYNIVPGSADKSILVYRMQSRDPGEMMPELGRKLVHKEGIAIIEEWINQIQ